MSITLTNPKDGADIGVVDSNGIGQLILSDKKAYTHRAGETITYEDNIGREIQGLYPFLINVNEMPIDNRYAEVILNGQSYYYDKETNTAFSKEDYDKKVVERALEMQEVKKKAVPAVPKEAFKVKVDKQAIARHNLDNTLKNFQDYARSDYQFTGEGLTAD